MYIYIYMYIWYIKTMYILYSPCYVPVISPTFHALKPGPRQMFLLRTIRLYFKRPRRRAWRSNDFVSITLPGRGLLAIQPGLFFVSFCLIGGLEHFCIFPYIGNDHPNGLIFFRGVETTNQFNLWRVIVTSCDPNFWYAPHISPNKIATGHTIEWGGWTYSPQLFRLVEVFVRFTNQPQTRLLDLLLGWHLTKCSKRSISKSLHRASTPRCCCRGLYSTPTLKKITWACARPELPRACTGPALLRACTGPDCCRQGPAGPNVRGGPASGGRVSGLGTSIACSTIPHASHRHSKKDWPQAPRPPDHFPSTDPGQTTEQLYVPSHITLLVSMMGKFTSPLSCTPVIISCGGPHHPPNLTVVVAHLEKLHLLPSHRQAAPADKREHQVQVEVAAP